MEQQDKRRIRTYVEEVTVPSHHEPQSGPQHEEPPPPLEQKKITPAVEEQIKSILKESPPTDNSLVIYIAVAVVTAAIVLGGAFFYLSSKGTASKKPSQTPAIIVPTLRPSPSPVATPTAEPEPEPVNLEEFSVSVLNGSGVVGAAREVRELLEDEGFVVGQTANADSFDFDETIVRAKKSVPKVVVDTAVAVLGEEYEVKIGSPLSGSEREDIVITVGAK